ncbi:hypothetical protein D6D18_01412 [Aureobasidium pullulans]|nr:hypothetical protein D6D18_01412 [Aureobasidium pullulans]
MSREQEALPYWLVNVPANQRPTECPDFLADANEKDKQILATPDSDYRRLSWPEVQDLIRKNRIDLFQRVPSDLRRYKGYTAKLKKEHGSVLSFVMSERLRWQDLVPQGEPFSNPEYLRYNNTVVPTATITQPPNSTVFLGGYIADLGETPILPGVQTDINGPYYGGAYDGTVLLASNDTRYDDVYTTIASPTPFMTFASLYVFSGQLNSAGTCMGTYRTTYPCLVPDIFERCDQHDECNVHQYSKYHGSRACQQNIDNRTHKHDDDNTATPPSSVQSPHDSNKDTTPPAAPTPEKSTEATSQGNTAAASSLTSVASGDTVSPTILPPQTTQNQVSSDQPTDDASKTTAPDSAETNMGKPSDVTTKAAVSQEAGSSKVAPSQNNVPAADTTTQAIRTTDPVMIVIGGATATLLSSVALVIETTIPRTGGLAIQTSGTTDLAQPSEALTDVETSPVSSSPASVLIPAPVVIGKVTATPIVSGGFIIGDQTVAPGSPAVEVSGTTYSIQASQSNVIVNGQTLVASAYDHPTTPEVVGSATDRSYSSVAYAIGGQTLSAGGPAIELSGTTYSLQPSGGNVLVNGQSASVSTIAPQEPPSAPVAFGEIKATPVASGGSGITISGTIYSLPPSATGEVVINGKAASLSAAASAGGVLAFGSQQLSFTPLKSGIVVASQTLYPGGPAITVDGQMLSLPTGGGSLVIMSGTRTTTENLGDYIWQGIASSTSESIPGSFSDSDVSSGSSVPPISSSHPGITSTTVESPTGTETAITSQTTSSNGGSSSPSASLTGIVVALTIFVLGVVLW